MNDIVERLLPCPCGAEARIYDVSGITEPRGKKVVACIDPDCDWSMTGYGDEQATKRWNRRATQPVAAKGEEVEVCPNCVSPWKCNGPHVGETPDHGYTTPPSTPAAVEVTEEMVSRAFAAWIDHWEEEILPGDKNAMRAALAAALTKPGAGGEDA